ncbi:hypothetical protein GCM10009555_052220 [Acrocarpospora macrocephala]|uniref:Uncharacterized protein n=1 Tax=Acrocarpospora macrocephala TaxID=150177 RepID=A0A5M3X7A1_9ACTN|nr:hypothetical protein [Acrocarpospora macrocephala]GES16552.1 hypothetical protein Amac_101500 [Acrocarpospora macrocephala]
MDAEDLSLGEPEAWFRRHLPALIAVVAIGAIVTAGWFFQRAEPPPTTRQAVLKSLPPPESWPTQNRFYIQVCANKVRTPRCAGKNATKADLMAIMLVRDPRTTALRPYDSLERYHRRTNEYLFDDAPSGRLPRTDVNFFVGSVRNPADLQPIMTLYREMAGVDWVDPLPVNFWEYNADVQVGLCGTLGCAGRGPATDAEKEAILARVHALPNIEAVYFEDLAHLRRTYETNFADAEPLYTARAPYGESFYVKLKEWGSAFETIRLLGTMPGIRRATTVDPMLPRN